MPTEIQIVYTDIQTGRIARIADYFPMVTPADLEELTWQNLQYRLIPAGVYQNPNDWEITMMNTFRKSSGELSPESKIRMEALSLRASCLENFSRIINTMRFRRTKHVYGWAQLVPLYIAEIKTYRETNVAGQLLSSLVEDVSDLPVAIAEFELTNAEYENFLQSTEVMRNKWVRQIKQAEDPVKALDSITRAIGM